MIEKNMPKQTIIFYVDVQGYSRLMQDDEAATVETLKHYRSIMADLIRQHSAKVVDASPETGFALKLIRLAVLFKIMSIAKKLSPVFAKPDWNGGEKFNDRNRWFDHKSNYINISKNLVFLRTRIMRHL